MTRWSVNFRSSVCSDGLVFISNININWYRTIFKWFKCVNVIIRSWKIVRI